MNSQNFTDDLEVRVTILEDNVADLELDVQDLGTDNNNQDVALNILDEAVIENTNDISGQYQHLGSCLTRHDYKRDINEYVILDFCI